MRAKRAIADDLRWATKTCAGCGVRWMTMWALLLMGSLFYCAPEEDNSRQNSNQKRTVELGLALSLV